ncbi:MAG TPA: YdeI/OmpD-associated family protein [Patescibacteria group bacterium]|nr:YdeI/OmpD-associated family protein [Patescibacteria group bacterium]
MKRFDLPVKFFRTDKDWEKWLAKNYHKRDGIWLKFYKKRSGVASLKYDGALDVALCYGWIDGQLKSFDEQAYLQRFTPRRKGSIWSKRNTEHIARLKRAGRMKPSGMIAVKLAKASGAWERAYKSPSQMRMPEDFLALLNKNKTAKEFFATLNKANTYAIAWRIQNVKPENRARRIGEIIKMLSKKQKLH